MNLKTGYFFENTVLQSVDHLLLLSASAPDICKTDIKFTKEIFFYSVEV